MQNFRILVADDHEIVRLGVRSILSSQPELQVCGEASNAEELIVQAEKLRPDILITEIAAQRLNGLHAVRKILRILPDQKILALTACDSEALAQRALEAGIRGLLLKSDAAIELRAALEALIKGAMYLTRRVSEILLQGFLRQNGSSLSDVRQCMSLTAREKDIVKAIARGMSSRTISKHLGLTIKTVESHRINMMRKLDLHSVAEVVLYAVRNDMLSVDRHSFDLSAYCRALSKGRNVADCSNENSCLPEHELSEAGSAATPSGR